MKERGILFNGEMVRAILEGRKTQTRRVIKPQSLVDTLNKLAKSERDLSEQLGEDVVTFTRDGVEGWCPYGKPGSELWVRETWGSLNSDHPRCKGGRKPKEGDRLVYKANPAHDYQWGAGKNSQGSFCWRPSIFMPRWASRILLEIINIRVERVQDIKEEDAIAEGITMIGPAALSNRTSFARLWDSINAKRGYGWDVNPFVWIIEFKRVEK
jgi:hypothetical protein